MMMDEGPGGNRMNNHIGSAIIPMTREQQFAEMFNSPGSYNVQELFDISAEMTKPPSYVLFPSNFDKRYVQRCIIDTNYTEFPPTINGRKFQYVRWPAYSLGVYYGGTSPRIIYDRVMFCLEVPIRSWDAMFYKATSRQFSSLLQELHREHGRIPLLEVHFKKNGRSDYELMFLAIVEKIKTTKDAHVWQRTRWMFATSNWKDKRYNKGLDVLNPEG